MGSMTSVELRDFVRNCAPGAWVEALDDDGIVVNGRMNVVDFNQALRTLTARKEQHHDQA